MSESSERIERLSPAKTALLAIEKMRSRLEELERRRAEPIAIVGVGCRFPGGGNGPDSFWRLLREGTDTVTDIPPDRWDIAAFYDADPQALGKSYTRQGAYLRHVDMFDPGFFGISPREAVHMDPQQRLLLEVCWEALEDAGCPPDGLAGTRTGVFVGICNSDYKDAHDGALDPEQIDAYTGTGNLFAVAAGRVSHFLGLQGPSLAVDTACSSSLVAVHLACQSLRQGECETALAGGVNLILSPFGNIFLSRAQAIAADGRCRTFDAAASGYGRGEGCGIVVLKRLSDATAAGDRLLAIIRGSAVNHDGRSSGLTVPNGSAQQALLRQALDNAGVDAAEVAYVEAHGTGTALGDPIEVRSLAAVLCERRSTDRPLIVGSVKTNVGHLEAAAGVAGLIKVVLCLVHDEIAPHLHLRTLNPYIAEQAPPLTIPAGPTRWPAGNGRRLAGVSAFGLGGTNAHVIVEAAPLPAPRVPGPDRPLHVLPLSARCEKALGQLIRDFQVRLAQDPDPSLADVAHTSGVGRCHFPRRASVVAASREEAVDGLRSLEQSLDGPGTLADGQSPRVFRGTAAGPRPSLDFVFGGGDALCPGMGLELYETHPPFRRTLDHCLEILRHDLGEPVACRSGSGVAGLLEEPRFAPVAAFALNYALAALWRSWGIEADRLVAEGLGEYAAAVWAGVFSLENGVKLVVERVKLSGVGVAPAPLVLGGSAQRRSALESLPDDSALDAYAAAWAGVRCEAPRLPLISLAGGHPIPASEPDYWRDHPFRPAGSPARSRAGRGDGDLSLELVPVAARPAPTLWSLGERGDWAVLATSLARLYVEGFDVDWPSFDRPYPRRRVALPSYPFQRQRFWKQRSPSLPHARRSGRRHRSDPLLGRRLLSPLSDVTFESSYGLSSLPCLGDHRFYGTVIVAGSCYLSMVLAGVSEEFKSADTVLNDVAFPQPMILDGGARTVQLILSLDARGAVDFRILSADPANAEADEDVPVDWKLHAAGRLPAKGGDGESAPRICLDDLRPRMREEVSAAEFYRMGRQGGMEAGPSFQWVHRLWRGQGEALAEMIAPDGSDADGAFQWHPGLIDSCFQILGACLEPGVYPPASGQIPVVTKVDRLRARRRPSGRMWAHLRLAPGAAASDGRSFDSDLRLFDDDGDVLLDVSGLQVRLVEHAELLRRQHKQVTRWVHELQWTEAGAPGEGSPPWKADTWMILSDGKGVGTALAGSLRAAGRRCLLVSPGESFASRDGDRYEVACTDPRAFDPLVPMLLASGPRPVGVVHLWSLDLSADEARMPETLARALRLSLHATVQLLSSLVRLQAEARLWLVTQGAQALGSAGPLAVAQSPLWGLGGVVALEHPEFSCTRVDLDATDGSDPARALFSELAADDREDRVAYRGAVRNVARLVPGPALSLTSEDRSPLGPPLAIPEFPRLFDPGATYLITGGAGGLGRHVAAWMVSQGVRHLRLVSRRVEGPEPAALVEESGRQGADLRFVAADVADLAGLAQVIGSIDALHPLKGVVHAAGVLDDGPLLDLDPARLSSVLAPKVQGAWNLHVLTRSHPLHMFVLFSSSAAVLGSPGQGNYAAANAFLDALAHERRRQGLPAQSINWGPWAGGQGMSARLGPREVERWKQAGIGFISPRQGTEALGEILLRRGPAQVAVLPIDWSRFRGIEAKGPPRFLSLLVPLGKTGAGSAPARGLGAELHAAGDDDRRAFLMEHLRAQAAGVLGLPPSAPLDPATGLDELGLDSLMAIELRNALQETLGRPLPATLLYEHRTLAALADYLLADLADKEA